MDDIQGLTLAREVVMAELTCLILLTPEQLVQRKAMWAEVVRLTEDLGGFQTIFPKAAYRRVMRQVEQATVNKVRTSAADV